MKKTIKVEGMKCEHCAAKLEQMLNTVEGVTARVDFPPEGEFRPAAPAAFTTLQQAGDDPVTPAG